MPRFAWGAAIALSLSLAAGCQAPMPLHQMKQPWFALGEAGTAGVSTRSDVTGGRLTVRFDREFAGMRRVQAVVADVEKVVVTVRTQDGAEVSETVLKAALNNGQTSVTFSGLSPGSATVTIAAYDAAGANIGSTSRVASIVAGQVASVVISLQLLPTFVENVGGGGSPTTGGLSVNAGIFDGPVRHGAGAPAGTLLGVTINSSVGAALAADEDGDMWVVGYEPDPDGGLFSGGTVVKISPSGERLAKIKLPSLLDDVAIDSKNHVWIAGMHDPSVGTAHVYELDTQGVEIARYSVPSGVKALTLDMNDSVFVGVLPDDSVFKVVGGIRQQFLRLPSGVQDMAVDSVSRVWVLGNDSTIMAYGPNGSLVKSIALKVDGEQAGLPLVGQGVGTLAVDRDGNLWALTGKGVLQRFSQDGELLGLWTGYDVPGNSQMQSSSQRLVPDPQGGMWVRGLNRVDKFDAGGHIQLSLPVPTPYSLAGGMVIHGNTLWVTDGAFRIYRFAL